MNIIIERDYEAMSKRAAERIAAEIRKRTRLVLGLATGSTPIGLYRCWAEQVRRGELSFTGVTTFNLDEYLGLPPHHPQSYHTFMQEQLFRYLDIPAEMTHIPRGDAENVDAHCREYEELIRMAGGIDIQVLGIGRNGHIGFNEPGESFGRSTHVVALSETTRQANARFFPAGETVPTHAITMGLKSIMNARQVLLLASGADKSEAVRRAVCGEVTPEHPASILQLHPDCVFLLDEAAASLLPAEGECGRTASVRRENRT
jgi:glucosamine-6-phosphate deaminase